jgi:GntR family transcriptional regulator
LYAFFEAEFGVRMIRAEEQIRAVAAAPPIAELLQVAMGTPMLSVERLSLSYNDRPVEFRRGTYRTDAHYYRNQLN